MDWFVVTACIIIVGVLLYVLKNAIDDFCDEVNKFLDD